MIEDKDGKALKWLAKFSTPDTAKDNLIRAALLITAFETFREGVTSKLLGFFSREWSDKGPRADANYDEKVGALHKNRFRASCLWFVQNGALDQSDLQSIEECRRHRNDVVHQLLKYLVDPSAEVRVEMIEELGRLQLKVERWWVTAIEIPTNPDMDGQLVDEESIQSAATLIFNIIKAVVGRPMPTPDASDAW